MSFARYPPRVVKQREEMAAPTQLDPERQWQYALSQLLSVAVQRIDQTLLEGLDLSAMFKDGSQLGGQLRT